MFLKMDTLAIKRMKSLRTIDLTEELLKVKVWCNEQLHSVF